MYIILSILHVNNIIDMFSKLFLWALANIFLNTLADDILVTIPNGKLKGRQEFSLRNISFYCFEQIPFAKPPLGDLRFKSPQPADKWEGILDATSGNKICYQQIANVDPSTGVETEDCLFVNVYTPQYPQEDLNLPVMVYIYGGGFVNGNAVYSQNGPHYFMENGVILVTIAYRVGPFGFITTGDTIIPGNYGLKDQNLALKWVQDNIKYFGGDPSKVTIFGESAGGASVTYQLMSRKSEGLFRAAIAQSGSVLNPWAYQRNYKDFAYGLATYLNPNFNKNESSQELLQYLQGVTAAQLKEAHLSFQETLANSQILQGFWFTPVVEPEHEDAFITEAMYSAIEGGHMNKVPLLIGMCSEELIGFAYSGVDAFKQTMRSFDFDVRLLVNGNMHLDDGSAAKVQAGSAIRRMYTDGELENDPASSIHYLSDTGFNRGLIHHAKLQSQFSDVWFYQFSYHGILAHIDIYIEGADRVGHGEYNAYLFVSNNNSNLNDYPASDVLTSERYRAIFTNFAKTLNPTPDGGKWPLENVVWPKVSYDNFQYLNFNDTLTVESNPKGDRYTKWVQFYEQWAVKPYDTF